MQPITGPLGTEIAFASYYKYRELYKQVKPYNLRLPYYARETSGGDGISSPASFGFEPKQNERDLCNNLCYDRFFSKVRNISSNQAGWGMTLGQHQKARAMFNKRGSDLLEYITLLEKNFRRNRIRRTTKQWASFFLECRFGWLPIINDIYSSMEILSSKPKTGLVKSSAKRPYKESNIKTTDWSVRSQWTGMIRTSMIADVEISNPNLYLLNELGLINPLVVMHDRIPWLFLVDWWVNFAQVAGSFTDTYGLSISNAVTAQKVENTGTWGYYRKTSPPTIVDNYGYATKEIDRVAGIKGPSIAIKPFTGLSTVRGATAIALTLQFLSPDTAEPGVKRNKRRYKDIPWSNW